MKKYLSIIALLFANLFYAQQIVDISTYNSGSNANKYFKDINNNYNNFIGTWESTNGNITFRITLVKVTVSCAFGQDFNCTMDKIKGSYKILQNAGTPNETILFDSVKHISNRIWEYVISLRSNNGTSAYGWIEDNNAICPNQSQCVREAWTYLKILPNTNGLQAEWKLKIEGVRSAGDTFRVPTETIMTKVN